ncbi:hypothetical protein [Methylobacterium radiotolerans]
MAPARADQLLADAASGCRSVRQARESALATDSVEQIAEALDLVDSAFGDGLVIGCPDLLDLDR